MVCRSFRQRAQGDNSTLRGLGVGQAVTLRIVPSHREPLTIHAHVTSLLANDETFHFLK